MDRSHHNRDLSTLMKKIAEKAKEDGEISDDEYKILEKVSFDVAEYMVFLEKASDDDEIDEIERKTLLNLRKKILFNAMEVASEDGRVTDEEHALISEIIRILNE